MSELTGQIEKISFENIESGYTIAKVRCDQIHGLVTVVGSLMSPPVGTRLSMSGEWQNHPKFGRQFKVETFRTEIPVTLEGIKKYLGSGMIKGLGEKMAERIVKTFGKNTLEIIENHIERLAEVDGIGEKRLVMIQTAWADQRNIRDVMLFLQSHGVSTGFAVKIYKQYQSESIAIVRHNPYVLATDISGIGFKTADTIAGQIGFSRTSPFRVSAGLLFSLHSVTEDGHVFYPMELLIRKSIELLSVERDDVEQALARLASEKKIIVDDRQSRLPVDQGPPVYPAHLFYCERGVAARLKHIVTTPSPCPFLSIDAEVVWAEKNLSISLAPAQKKAVTTALSSKGLVITGGPGTGKTTIINVILKIFSRASQRILLAAPTGRAAKRMSETSGHPSKTIHRLLEFSYKGGGFQRNEERPLFCDILVVDEASMIDINLMFHLVKAVPPQAVIILVGDVSQLPSVGPGNVLNDIIHSGLLSVVTLNDIFRQANNSKIIVNAHKINRGDFPSTGPSSTGDDYYFIEQDNPDKIAQTIIELVKNRIPRRFNLDPLEDIQVLTPMHRGILGSENLNTLLQDALNSGNGTIERGSRRFRVNDKVMQLRNNYDKDVFNGDIGKITHIDPVNQVIQVVFDGKTVSYDFMDLDEIQLAYAISVHKSQGSEYPAVVMPVTTQHYILLQRNLVYTGLTRAKELAVIIGTKKAMAMAIRNNKPCERFTLLTERLKHA